MYGKGSKRLLSMAIQLALAKAGGIVLIDEIEQGLEPDRIRTIINKLSQVETGQIFVTTTLGILLLRVNPTRFI